MKIWVRIPDWIVWFLAFWLSHLSLIQQISAASLILSIQKPKSGRVQGWGGWWGWECKDTSARKDRGSWQSLYSPSWWVWSSLGSHKHCSGWKKVYQMCQQIKIKNQFTSTNQKSQDCEVPASVWRPFVSLHLWLNP